MTDFDYTNAADGYLEIDPNWPLRLRGIAEMRALMFTQSSLDKARALFDSIQAIVDDMKRSPRHTIIDETIDQKKLMELLKCEKGKTWVLSPLAGVPYLEELELKKGKA